VRKAIGGVLMLAFLAGYVVVMSMIGERVPNLWWARLVFYAVAGTLWGAPIIPLITWMNAGRWR
jgi:hypothetical protein